MQKKDLIDRISKNTGISKKDTGAVVNALFSTIIDGLKAGEETKIIGFGTFAVTERAARKGLNPVTKETIDIPACKVVKFKAGKLLKEEIH